MDKLNKSENKDSKSKEKNHRTNDNTQKDSCFVSNNPLQNNGLGLINQKNNLVTKLELSSGNNTLSNDSLQSPKIIKNNKRKRCCKIVLISLFFSFLATVGVTLLIIFLVIKRNNNSEYILDGKNDTEISDNFCNNTKYNCSEDLLDNL